MGYVGHVGWNGGIRNRNLQHQHGYYKNRIGFNWSAEREKITSLGEVIFYEWFCHSNGTSIPNTNNPSCQGCCHKIDMGERLAALSFVSE